jgi:hypothetical protein
VVSGNVGVSPGSAVTGFPPAVVQNGQIYTGVGSLAGPALIRSVQATRVNLSSERDNLIATSNSGADLTLSRAAVVRSMADNAVSSRRKYKAALVLTEYFGYLRRDPESGGYEFWLSAVNNLGDYRGLVCSFIN